MSNLRGCLLSLTRRRSCPARNQASRRFCMTYAPHSPGPFLAILTALTPLWFIHNSYVHAVRRHITDSDLNRQRASILYVTLRDSTPIWNVTISCRTSNTCRQANTDGASRILVRGESGSIICRQPYSDGFLVP
jgi:hypothetical protein